MSSSPRVTELSQVDQWFETHELLEGTDREVIVISRRVLGNHPFKDAGLGTLQGVLSSNIVNLVTYPIRATADDLFMHLLAGGLTATCTSLAVGWMGRWSFRVIEHFELNKIKRAAIGGLGSAALGLVIGNGISVGLNHAFLPVPYQAIAVTIPGMVGAISSIFVKYVPSMSAAAAIGSGIAWGIGYGFGNVLTEGLNEVIVTVFLGAFAGAFSCPPVFDPNLTDEN